MMKLRILRTITFTRRVPVQIPDSSWFDATADARSTGRGRGIGGE
jgi:hypothetical protein